MVIFDAPFHRKFRGVSKINRIASSPASFEHNASPSTEYVMCYQPPELLIHARILNKRYEFSCLLRRYTVSTGKQLPTFRRYYIPIRWLNIYQSTNATFRNI
jgi:hypothetical protein